MFKYSLNLVHTLVIERLEGPTVLRAIKPKGQKSV
jgi:hypothetical protein